MARWVERPRVYPHRCFMSHKGDIESGPYYEFEREYYEQPSDDATPARFYISRKYLLMALQADGGPKLASAEQHEALQAERDDLATRVEELEAENNLLSLQLDQERDVFARARVKAPKRAPRAKADD